MFKGLLIHNPFFYLQLGLNSTVMKAAPLPQNEDERLAELLSYDVLDTEAEQLFDDLTALA